ncbi:unnamed protein product [Nesidiocoris tenuis]|uniref:Uncharacterized protein n=1 Tax=Nesidiocoris tenuis TaxID=355587 RepID=A0A6H5HGS1_9HEMI|nr:unnamed protein product [Nesidiocoris tenuis]
MWSASQRHPFICCGIARVAGKLRRGLLSWKKVPRVLLDLGTDSILCTTTQCNAFNRKWFMMAITPKALESIFLKFANMPCTPRTRGAFLPSTDWRYSYSDITDNFLNEGLRVLVKTSTRSTPRLGNKPLLTMPARTTAHYFSAPSGQAIPKQKKSAWTQSIYQVFISTNSNPRPYQLRVSSFCGLSNHRSALGGHNLLDRTESY